MDLKSTIREEWTKIKKMPGRDRVWYIWEYYKFHLLAVVVAVCVLSVIGTMIYRSTFTTRLSFAVINDHSGGASSLDPLTEQLKEQFGYGPKDVIEVNEGLMAAFGDDAGMSQYDYASLAKITALVAGESLDLMITEPEAITHYESLDGFLDLSQFLPAELYEKVEPSLIFAEGADGVSRPVALSLADTEFPALTGIVMDPPCLAVVSNSPHKEDTLKTIEYLFR